MFRRSILLGGCLRNKLEPPINVLELATRYAKLEAFPLSLNIDGVSLHVKSKGRQATIILNEIVRQPAGGSR